MDLDILLELCTDLVKDIIISIVASIIAEKLTGWKSTRRETPSVFDRDDRFRPRPEFARTL